MCTDVSLALTNDLRYMRAVLFLNNSKLFAFCTTYFPKIYINHQKQFSIPMYNLNNGGCGSAQALLGLRPDPAGEAYIVALSPVIMGT